MHRYRTISNQIGFKASDFIVMPELFCNDVLSFISC